MIQIEDFYDKRKLNHWLKKKTKEGVEIIDIKVNIMDHTSKFFRIYTVIYEDDQERLPD